MAKIDGVDDDVNKEAGGREAHDEREKFGNRMLYASTILASQVNGKGRNTR